MFGNEIVQDYIKFKWEKFGRNLHLIGCFAHIFYIIMISNYTYIVYVKNAIKYKVNPEDPESGGFFE